MNGSWVSSSIFLIRRGHWWWYEVKTRIHHFFTTIKIKPYNPDTQFLFFDKEILQLKSIQTLFNVQLSVSLRNIKRAVKRKIFELRRLATAGIDTREENRLLNLIGVHYFRKSVFIMLNKPACTIKR